MGNVTSDGKPKIRLDIKKKSYKTFDVVIPFSQLDMIKVLQRNFNYEVKGTLYFDHDNKFKSFEVRTDNSELFSTGSSEWKISYHTHPDNTAKKYGLRYYSPPSPTDVLEIIDRTMQFIPNNISQMLGEISLVFTNEGIYIMQADRNLFSACKMKDMNDEEMEEYLKTEFNKFITQYVISGLRNIDPKVNLQNPNVTIDQFSNILSNMSKEITKVFGFKMSFYSWNQLKEKGLHLTTNDYHVEKVND